MAAAPARRKARRKRPASGPTRRRGGKASEGWAVIEGPAVVSAEPPLAFQVAPANPHGGWSMVPETANPSTPTNAPATMTPTGWTQTSGAAAPAPAVPQWKMRGLPWLATIGWVVFVIGLWLPYYMYQWGRTNDATYAPMGVPGTVLALLVILIGLAAGIVFTFVPPNQPAPWHAGVPAAWIWERIRSLQAQARIAWTLSIVGLSLVVIGLSFSAWVALVWLNNKSAETFTFLQTELAFGTWISTFFVLTAVGLVLALVFFFRIPVYREAIWAAQAAALRGPGASMPMGPAPAGVAMATGQALPPGVSGAHLEALMRRIDVLLANLPEEIVGEFSKSPEADTYLKILGTARPETASPERKTTPRKK